jgi:3-oxosteroid 1-dehydrogenase
LREEFAKLRVQINDEKSRVVDLARGEGFGLGEGPYYAIEVKSGALGTKGGPQTESDARVLDVDGGVIPGLYAAGNVMASPMGMTYGGAGGTLGPGMVFGFRAGKHAASTLASPALT